MSKEYIEEREGNFYVAGTRISLDSIVHAFRRGESPETICQNFELLRIEEVYGPIAFYLANQAAHNSAAPAFISALTASMTSLQAAFTSG
jgi:uncharacterized protein (DUF433 family)